MTPGKVINLAQHLATKRQRREQKDKRPPDNIIRFDFNRIMAADSVKVGAGEAPIAAEVKSKKLGDAGALAPVVQLRRALECGDYKVDTLELAEILFDAIFVDDRPDDCG